MGKENTDINIQEKVSGGSLPDTQGQTDKREIPIDKVGIKSLRYPILVKDRDNEVQNTVATISMTVDLPKEFKGTHMSRFVEVLQCSEGKREIHIDTVYEILEKMQKKLNAVTSHLEMEFPYFRKKSAPVTGKPSMIDYNVIFHAVMGKDYKDFILTVKIPVTTLCPCSKNIAEYGAHNQRGEASVSVRFDDTVWIEDVIEIAEKSASSELYTLLKREDEKYVTEKAYENPVFVEDLVRNIVQRLKKDPKIKWYKVQAENFESIHNHNAYAMIESHKFSLNGNLNAK